MQSHSSSSPATMQVLRCDRRGQSFVVSVDEIASIERDRQAMYRTLLVERDTGIRIPVDRVGGVTEVLRSSLIELPARLASANSGLQGMVDTDGVMLPLVSSRYLREDREIAVSPGAVRRTPAI